MAFSPFFLFRQLCLYISDSLHLFTLFLTDSLKKCQTKNFENEYSTVCNSTNEKVTESDYKPTVKCTCGNGKMRGQVRRKFRDCFRDTCNQTKMLPLKKDRKSAMVCKKCNKNVCKEHSSVICYNCS